MDQDKNNDYTVIDEPVANENHMAPGRAPRRKGGNLVIILLAISLCTNVFMAYRLAYTRSRPSRTYTATNTMIADDFNSIEFYTDGAMMTMEDLIDIAPYMNSSDLGEICMRLVEMQGITADQLADLAPYLNSSDLGEIALRMLEYGLSFSDTLAETIIADMVMDGGISIQFRK